MTAINATDGTGETHASIRNQTFFELFQGAQGVDIFRVLSCCKLLEELMEKAVLA
jgi:hypothetical protein